MQAVQTYFESAKAQQCRANVLPTRSADSDQGKFAFDIAVYHKDDAQRQAVEQFIQDGFLRTYGAKVHVSMPWVLAIKNGSFKAALGIRPATESLFLEQYIERPIETYLPAANAKLSRDSIAEIGHLYSNSNKFTIPLFLTTAVSLFYNQFEFMVFSATEHVLNLVARAGIEFQTICDADPSKLSPCDDKWGSYYDTHPKVVAVSLPDVMRVINHNQRYNKMFEKLKARIASTSKTIQRGAT